MNDNKQELPFRLQITDNRTGEVLTDKNVSCILGGLASDEERGEIVLSSCNVEVIAKAAFSAITVLQKIMDEHSDVKTLVPFYMALNKKSNE